MSRDSAAATLNVVSEQLAPLNERLIVALDFPTTAQARELVDTLGDSVVFYKIGLMLQYIGGLQLAEELVQEGKKVFLDSKIFDIEQTVAGAVASVAGMGVSFLTVHGNGPVIRAAVRGRGEADLKILTVTVLTSLDAQDMDDLGYACSVEELVLSRARQTLEAGGDGVIASGHEVAQIREMAGRGLIIVSPGIRSEGISHDDQKRVMTPSAAISAGADYLVVGRQISQHDQPRAEADRILAEMAAAFAALQ